MKNKVVIVGIAGASASGKSLLASKIVERINSNKVQVIPEDAYYKDLSQLSLWERSKVNFDHPDAIDHALLCQHLQLLQQGKRVEIPCYDHGQHVRKSEIRVIEQYSIIILEGILLFTLAELRSYMDIKIFIDTPLDICLIRRIERDMRERERTLQSIIDQYQLTVRPMYTLFIEPAKYHADIIVPHGGGNLVAIEMIEAKLRELLT